MAHILKHNRKDSPAKGTSSSGGGEERAGPTRASTPERVAAAISRAILMRQFSAGQRLIEADLQRSLQVSRGTVREALRILDASGVVELTPHRGAVIRVLDRTDSENLLEVMEVLSGLAARLAAKKIAKPGNRGRFEAAAAKLVAPHDAGRLESVLDERLDFYKVMFSIADNSELDHVLPLARAHLMRTQFHQYLMPADIRAMVREYRGIAQAILAGDERNAESRMRIHIRKTAERMIPRLVGLSLE